MIRKLICASMLVTSAVPAFGQDMSRSGATGPHMHQCTVTPGPDWQGDTAPIPSIRPVVKKNTYRDAATPAGSRIDLEFTTSAPSAGGSVPTVSGFAINTKGTGANSGRLSPNFGATATVGCTSSAITGDAATEKASADMYLQIPRDARTSGWSCSVTGGENAPQFVLTLLVPTILGQAERKGKVVKQSRVGREDAILESKRSIGGHRVSIVPRGSGVASAPRVACSSGSQKGTTGWEVLILS